MLSIMVSVMHHISMNVQIPFPHDTYTYSEIEVALQQQLLDKDKANKEMDDIFLRMLSEVVGRTWPSLASLLSFTVVEVEELAKEKNPALTMMQKWRAAARPTYSVFMSLLQAPFLLPAFFHGILPKTKPPAVRPPSNVRKSSGK